jgi:MFS family permease
LWAGQSLSLLGDQVTLIALPLAAVESFHAGALSVGALGACLRFPFLVLGLPAGVWVTRRGLVRSMLAADILRGVSIALLPLLIIAGARSVGILFAGALALGVGTVFFQVAYQSTVPELVADENGWHPANTRLSLSESTALFAGPALGGVVVAALTPTGALGIDALSYGASVAALLAITANRRSARSAVPSAGIAAARPRLRTEIGEGIRYVRHNAVLNALMWTGACYNLGSSMYDTLVVVFAVRYLHIPPAHLGVVIGLGSIGFPVGSVLSKYANARLGLGPSLIWAAFPSVGGLIVAALAAGDHPEILLAAGTLLIGLGQGCFAVNAITLRQLNSIPSMRAQATSVHRFLSWGALPVGALIAGALGQFLGLRPAMLASGIVASLCFIPLFSSPLRRRSGAKTPSTLEPEVIR